MATLQEDIFTFMAKSRSVLLRMRNVSDKVMEKIKTHFMFNNCIPKIVQFMRKCGKILWSQRGQS